MKRTFVTLVLCLLAAPCLAGIPAKTEMAVSGAYLHPKHGDSVYAFDGQLAAPLNPGGNILFGPKLRYSSNDADNAAGAVLEVNFLGTSKSGPFIGANGLYNLKDVAGTERYTVDAVAGLKLQIGPGAFVRIQAAKGIAGRGKDSTDILGSVGVGIRF